MSEYDFQDLYNLEDSSPTATDEDEFNYDEDDDDEIDFYTDVRRVRFLPITENGFVTEPRDVLTQEEVQQLISGTANETRTDYQALNEKISQLLNDETSSDIIVQASDIKLHAHQLILGLWSDAFQNLLEKPDRSWTSHEDCQKYVLSLTESPAEMNVFGDFLKFMYNKDVIIHIDHIWKLISLAEKYGVEDLKNECSKALVHHIYNSPINEQLVHLLSPAATWKMSDLHEAIMLRILHNIYFFSDDLLPTLNIDQLCKVLERSDLVVEDEYKLLQLLMPRLEKLQNDEDHTSLMKILNLVRFTEMSGMQLNEVKQYKLMKPMKLKLSEATFNRCLLWEGQESSVDSMGPRLYLNPPLPYVTIYRGRSSSLDIPFQPNCDGDWKYCAQLTVEPDPEREMLPKATIHDKNLYFIQTNQSSVQRIIRYGPHIEQFQFQLQYNKLLVKLEMLKPNRKVKFPKDKKADMIIIVHGESKICKVPVLSTQVSIKIDFHNNVIQFTEPIEFNSGLVMPLSQELYVTLFAFIPSG